MKKLLLLTILVGSISYSMVPGDTDELYKLCSNWLMDHQIRNIASHIERMGKGFTQASCEIKTPTTLATFNRQDNMVEIRKIDFLGIPSADPVIKLSFGDIMHLNSYMNSRANT